LELKLDDIQVRVLGSLIEKEITTPEYYPLSLNALVNACNQKSSREPVMQLSEAEVRSALFSLEELKLVSRSDDGRVAKYEHRAREVLNLRRPEIAVICLLLLRGPQTPGELRNRSERLYSFDDISSVQSTLERLMRKETEAGQPRDALVALLPRQAGEKEARYAQTLSALPVIDSTREAVPSEKSDRISRLEAELANLREKIADLEVRIAALEANASSS